MSSPTPSESNAPGIELRLAVLLLSGLWTAAGIVHLANHNPGLGLIDLAAALSTVLLWAWQRRSDTFLHMLGVITLSALTSNALLAGGRSAPAVWVLATFPMYAAYMLPRAQTLPWIIITEALLAYLHFGPTLPAQLVRPVNQIEMFGAQCILSLLMFQLASFARQTRERHAADLIKEREATREQAALLRQKADEHEKQARQLSQARDEALRAMQAKDAFLANMSHELRTPLNAVIGLSGLLGDTPLDEQQKEYVDIINKSSRALLDLIGDILDISKLEAGKLEAEFNPFDPVAGVEDTLDLVATQAHAKDLELILDVAPGVPRVIASDLARFRQILANLLSNAVKFTREGEIHVRLSATVRDERMAELQVDVRDTGIGIPRERLDRLFQPFSQLDASTSREFGGTGLGLAISKALAALLGGRMWVTSEPGKGSTFSFSIAARVELDSLPASAAGTSVLIIDDNTTARAAIARMAQRLGASTVEASCEAEALTAVSERRYDLILVDLSVQAKNTPLALKIREATSPEQKILIMAPRSARERSALIVLGASYIPKPVRLSTLAAHIIPRPQRESLPDGAPESRELSVSSPHAGLQVLVVEDNPLNRKVILKMLEKLGHQAEAVDDGYAALEAVQRKRYHAILLDVNMPGIDGYQVAQALRQRYQHKTRRPRIIGATANALPGDREKCIAAGMDDYISKPIELEVLSRMLTSATPQVFSSSFATLLDPNLIDQLRSKGDGGEHLKKACRDFLARCPQLIEKLTTAIDPRDTVALREASAGLLSQARAMGSVQLAAAIIGVDLLIKSGRYSELEEQMPRLRSLYDRTEQAVLRLSRGGASPSQQLVS